LCLLWCSRQYRDWSIRMPCIRYLNSLISIMMSSRVNLNSIILNAVCKLCILILIKRISMVEVSLNVLDYPDAYLIGSMSLDVIESIPMLIRCSCIPILLLLQYKRPPSTNWRFPPITLGNAHNALKFTILL
jgi:hypothetical protein